VKKFSPEWWTSLKGHEAGKEVEKRVMDLFKDWNSHQAFAYHRLPDSAAARNYLVAQPADLVWRCGKHSGFLEVKALKKTHRLPATRLTQHAVLNKWALAGATNLVLVFHYPDLVWRVANVLDLPFGSVSWDLSKLPAFETAAAALTSTELFNAMGACE
jgi:hypothetical protein